MGQRGIGLPYQPSLALSCNDDLKSLAHRHGKFKTFIHYFQNALKNEAVALASMLAAHHRTPITTTRTTIIPTNIHVSITHTTFQWPLALHAPYRGCRTELHRGDHTRSPSTPVPVLVFSVPALGP